MEFMADKKDSEWGTHPRLCGQLPLNKWDYMVIEWD